MGTETSGDCPGRYLLNPAVVGEVDLPGLDEVRVLVFKAQSFWYRLERLILYVAGAGPWLGSPFSLDATGTENDERSDAHGNAPLS
jgi:hypothetical protein